MMVEILLYDDSIISAGNVSFYTKDKAYDEAMLEPQACLNTRELPRSLHRGIHMDPRRKIKKRKEKPKREEIKLSKERNDEWIIISHRKSTTGSTGHDPCDTIPPSESRRPGLSA